MEPLLFPDFKIWKKKCIHWKIVQLNIEMNEKILNNVDLKMLQCGSNLIKVFFLFTENVK